MGNRRAAAGLFAVLLVLLPFGCGSSQDHPALEVVRENSRTAEKENLDAFMDTIHPEAPIYDRTRTTMKRLIDAYDLTYELSGLKVTKQTKEEVHVEFIQVTKKKSGPKFRANRVKGVHRLKKHNGEWKIFHTKQKEVEYLD